MNFSLKYNFNSEIISGLNKFSESEVISGLKI